VLNLSSLDPHEYRYRLLAQTMDALDLRQAIVRIGIRQRP
jgi:hypothetical protein